jgi:hypothetical protein
MCELTRFWLDWSVQLLVAVGTIGAVVVALFGDAIKAKFVKLTLSIYDRDGVYSPTSNPVYFVGQVVGQAAGEARFYQLRVDNERRLVSAERVTVWLLQVMQFGDDGSTRSWTGELPLIWQHQDQIPGPRTIGSPATADLFCVTSAQKLELRVAIQALNLTRTYQGACRLVMTVQARSDEGNSPELRLSVQWDGKWERETGHVTFAVVDD